MSGQYRVHFTNRSWEIFRIDVKYVTFIAIKHDLCWTGVIAEKHSASVANCLYPTCTTDYQCEFVPLVSIDPGKLLLRTRAKTMEKLKFIPMALKKR